MISDIKKIQLSNKIGSGGFGNVFKIIVNQKQEFAFKTFRGGN
jgi:hypothetical protein